MRPPRCVEASARYWRMRREVIGAPDCPLMHRWTLWGDDSRGKLMVHHFLPNTTDPDVHDHPWPFLIFVLRGGYEDLVPCPDCVDGWVPGHRKLSCGTCKHWAFLVGDKLGAGSFRRRAARHRHRTRTGSRGAWTVVLTGPKRREWGFWREGRWWPFKLYEATFGFVMRCEERVTSFDEDDVAFRPDDDEITLAFWRGEGKRG